MRQNFTTKRIVCRCKRTVDDVPVKGGLSITPSEMYRLASQGVPVTNANLPFLDGDTNPSWNIPADRVRGIDVAELWQLQQDSKGKIVRAHLQDRANYED